MNDFSNLTKLMKTQNWISNIFQNVKKRNRKKNSSVF